VLAGRNAAWFGGLLSLGVLLLITSAFPVAPRLEERAAELVAPLTHAGASVLRPAADLLLHAGEVSALTRENAALRLDNARLESEAAALRERALATEQVTTLIEAAGPGVGRSVAAPVLLRDPSPSREVLVLGRGRQDGVAVGQPALGPGPTLVGVVTQVEERTSRVRLLSDRASAIAVLLERSRTPAALAGGNGSAALVLDLVPMDVGGVEGDLVLTSALGGLLPAGLPVGRVTRAIAREPELFQSIEVTPLTDYARLEHVLVLVDFHVDAQLGGQTNAPAPAGAAPR
jgi:rod shape-determining protein MreC